jgi:hypothetical protein
VDNLKAEIDTVRNTQLLQSHFKDYGQEVVKSIYREPNGVRFWLTTKPKEPKQVGLFSYFALAGDFEISVAYEILAASNPTAGYGVSCGIAVDSDDKIVQLLRGQQVKKAPAFIVSEGTKGGDGKMEFKDISEKAAKAKTGRLVLKREKSKLIALASDDVKGTLEEISQVTFTTGTVRKARFFADPGGAPNSLDVRFTQIRVRAEEISTDVPIRERDGTLFWWIAGITFLVVAVGAFFAIRRYRNREEE